MGSFFVPSSTQKATFEPRYDSDGKVFLQAVAAAALTAKTPVSIIADEFGPVTLALASSAKYYRVGVPLAAASTGDLPWLQHGGYITDVVTSSITTTVGYGIEIDGGVVALVSADYSGASEEFAVCTEASGASTTHELMLVPRQILSST